MPEQRVTGRCTPRMHEATANAEGAPCHCGKYRLYLRTVTRSWLAFQPNDQARPAARPRRPEEAPSDG